MAPATKLYRWIDTLSARLGKKIVATMMMSTVAVLLTLGVAGQANAQMFPGWRPSGPGFVPPMAGPGFVPPMAGPGWRPPMAGPGFVPPMAGPGFVPPRPFMPATGGYPPPALPYPAPPPPYTAPQYATPYTQPAQQPTAGRPAEWTGGVTPNQLQGLQNWLGFLGTVVSF